VAVVPGWTFCGNKRSDGSLGYSEESERVWEVFLPLTVNKNTVHTVLFAGIFYVIHFSAYDKYSKTDPTCTILFFIYLSFLFIFSPTCFGK
jgi:hypothetical protein